MSMSAWLLEIDLEVVNTMSQEDPRPRRVRGSMSSYMVSAERSKARGSVPNAGSISMVGVLCNSCVSAWHHRLNTSKSYYQEVIDFNNRETSNVHVFAVESDAVDRLTTAVPVQYKYRYVQYSILVVHCSYYRSNNYRSLICHLSFKLINKIKKLRTRRVPTTGRLLQYRYRTVGTR